LSGLIDKIGLKPNIRPKMGKSSAEERFTVLFVSSRGRSRSLGFNIRTLKILGWTALVAAIVLGVFFTSYRAISKELAELRYMRDVAESQKEQIRSLQDQYTVLNDRVKEAELLESEIKDMLDREGLLPQGYTVGGASATIARRTSLATTSRDGSLSVRLSTPEDMGRALYTLAASAGALAEEASAVESRAKELHELSAKIVSRARATPSIWPVEGDISSDFGWRVNPFNYYTKEYHSGLDIAAGMWEPIVAPADGVVTFSGYKYGYGWTITIEHGYGIDTLYAHCCRLSASRGQKVTRGDVIAYVGQSGSATGPHLHYEVQLWGETVDPTQYFSNEVREVGHSVR
jgi:murein DD-endopeptidase MepM/ murein hydrolase activator NlpD